MASLDLKLEPAFEDQPAENLKSMGRRASASEKIFKILRDFLQPDTSLSLQSAGNSITEIFPKDAHSSPAVNSFGSVVFELAEQIPYHHPSQLKLVRLLEYVGRSPKVGGFTTSKERGDTYHHYQLLKEEMGDLYNFPEEDECDEWINLNAFYARMYEQRIISTDPTYPIWSMKEAFEGFPAPRSESYKLRDCVVSAAAQYIIWSGQTLFQQISYSADFGAHNEPAFQGGPLFDGEGVLTLRRWQFWRKGFEDAATSEKCGAECVNLAERAASLMSSIEENLTF